MGRLSFKHNQKKAIDTTGLYFFKFLGCIPEAPPLGGASEVGLCGAVGPPPIHGG